MELKEYLSKRQKIVDQFIHDYLATQKGVCTSRLLESMAYSLTAGGKRVRPILAIAGYVFNEYRKKSKNKSLTT